MLPPSEADAYGSTLINGSTCVLQYACMFISAGEPGNIKKVQASVTAARKVFRVMRVSTTIVFATFKSVWVCPRNWS